MPCTYHHLEGAEGLSKAIHRILEEKPKDVRTLLIFDFDRTLTNGFASPSLDLPIEKRIRGGLLTLNALRRAKSEGIDLFIITARSPTALTIESLEASMQNCQVELAEIFVPPASANEKCHVEKINGRYLAWRGPLFAADYSKPIALQQILSTYNVKTEEKVQVHFFDDFVMNAFDIGVADYGAHVTHVSTYWWDTYEEETRGLMGLVNSFSSDFPYQKGTEAARLAFGMNDEVSNERRKWYEQYEKDHNIVQTAKEELPPPAPVSVEVKRNLGNLLALRPRPPPPEGVGANAQFGL